MAFQYLNLDKLESQDVRWSTQDEEKKSKSSLERPTHPRSSVSPWSRCTPLKRACYSGLLVLLIARVLPAHYSVAAKDFWYSQAWPMIKDGIDQMMKKDEPEFPKEVEAIAGSVALIFWMVHWSPRFQPRHEVEAVHADDMKGAGWLGDGVLCICSGCTLGPPVLRARLDLDKLEAQHVRWLPGPGGKKGPTDGMEYQADVKDEHELGCMRIHRGPLVSISQRAARARTVDPVRCICTHN